MLMAANGIGPAYGKADKVGSLSKAAGFPPLQVGRFSLLLVVAQPNAQGDVFGERQPAAY